MLNAQFDQWLRETRQALHQIPELGFELPKTHQYLKTALEAMGYKPCVVAQSGLYVYLPGDAKETIAFRADMDALPVCESTNLPYQSTHPNQMHACGHDAHMTMLLGLAKQLKGKPLNHSVLLIFQPAEEGPGGAKEIVKSGLFERYNVKHIYGFHVFPGLDAGKIGLRSGPMMAQNGEFDLTVMGQSAHGAQPHLGHDAMSAGLAYAQALNTLTAKMITPLIPTVIVLGEFKAGEARNILAKEALLKGTIRTFDDTLYQTIKEKMHQLANGLAHAYGVSMTLEIRDFYPPVINHPSLIKHLQEALPTDDQVAIQPLMLAEDFAFYQQVIPGVFMLLGTRTKDPRTHHDLHSASFDFDESVLLKGVETYLTILNSFNDSISLKESTL